MSISLLRYFCSVIVVLVFSLPDRYVEFDMLLVSRDRIIGIVMLRWLFKDACVEIGMFSFLCFVRWDVEMVTLMWLCRDCCLEVAMLGLVCWYCYAELVVIRLLCSDCYPDDVMGSWCRARFFEIALLIFSCWDGCVEIAAGDRYVEASAAPPQWVGEMVLAQSNGS